MRTSTLTKSLLLALSAFALSGCLNKTKMVDLPDAENQLITSDGRHFVTGANSIYEITRHNGQYQKHAFGPKCNYAGLAEYQGYLLANCMEVKLINGKKAIYFGKLTKDALPEMLELADLSALSIPNGLAVKTEGELLIANSNYFGAGSIAMLHVEVTADGLHATGLEKNYLAATNNIQGANGLRMLGNTLYFTDFSPSTLHSRVGRVSFDDAGNVADVTILRDKLGVYDDLWPMCHGVVVADYLNGRLMFINQHGDVYQSSAQEFPGASSVMLASGGLYPANTLVITEKGILLETGTTIGNQLSQVQLSSALLNHVGCQL